MRLEVTYAICMVCGCGQVVPGTPAEHDLQRKIDRDLRPRSAECLPH
jgi:hypothetical protein